MPRKNNNLRDKPKDGNQGIQDDKIRLKLSAQESLKIVKSLEQQRIDSGTHTYVTSYDSNGKMLRTLVKKNT